MSKTRTNLSDEARLTLLNLKGISKIISKSWITHRTEEVRTSLADQDQILNEAEIIRVNAVVDLRQINLILDFPKGKEMELIK